MDKKYRVPRTAITEKGLRKLLRDAAKDEKSSVSDWAVENGITAQQVSAFLRKRQGAGLKIPEALGYRPQIVYLPLDEELITVMLPPRRVAKKPTSKVDHSKDPIEKRGFKAKDPKKEARDRLKARKK